ncbi:MAG: hypothetical protein ABH837_02740 [bacterium]
MFLKHSALDIIKLYSKDIQKYLIEIRDRMNMGVWKNDDFLELCIANMEKAIHEILNSSNFPEAKIPYCTLKNELKRLMNAVSEGKYDPRSLIGDNCLDIQAIIRGIDESISLSNIF